MISTTREMTNPDRSAKSLSNAKAPKKASYLEPYYKRPAGMYVSPFFAIGGSGLWSYGDLAFMMAKPFAEYLFEGEVNGEIDEDTHVSWDVFIRDETYYLNDVTDFLYSSYWWLDDAPKFYAVDGALDDPNANWYEYQIRAYDTEENTSGGVTVKGETPVEILTVDNNETVAIMFGEELEFMYSSKTMIHGGRNADQTGMLSRYYGADPWGDNEYGWWFGKNASHVDGMAMCFEKPQHPYLLKTVYLQCAYNSADYVGMVVNAPVKMKCRVYKIDEIPDYQEVGSAYMPLEPGELIVTGEATVTPTTGEANNGLITFTLYAQDDIDPSLTYEYHPTVDYPIMICIDGYNDPGMEDLVEFSAFVCVDDQVDEGYGELAYLKTGIYDYEIDENGDTIYDDDGNPVQYFTGEYRWRGLNNYFSRGMLTMKTGLTIFIGTENPYLTFVHGLEDGEYTFPDEGGFMTKTFEYSDGSVYTTESIDFLSSVQSEDGDIWMTWNGDEEMPEWLEINLVDNYEDGEFSGYVTAEVTAAPLPIGVSYREATIHFEIPGDYVDYKFMQGGNIGFIENGIYYRVNDNDDVIVCYKDKNFYRGDLVIPATVTHDSIEYHVDAIGELAFNNCPNLSSVTIPVGISSIANNAFTGTNVKSICLAGEGDWNGCSLPNSINTLYIGSMVTSVNGMGVKPTTVYSYSTVPPSCDNQSFTDYSGTLHVPSSAVAAYFTADYWCNFAQIIGDAVEPKNVSINHDSIDIMISDEAQLTATVTPTNATPKTISWFSSNDDVATVVNGHITTVSAGECDIFATCVGKQAICHVTVKEIAPSEILLSQENAIIEVNHQLTLTATVLPDSATYNTVTWSTTNASIATVDNGIVTALKAGECDIIATCRDLTAICHLTVVNQITVITLDEQELELLPNHIITLTPSASPYMPELQVTSSDPTVAAARLMNGKVQIVGIKEGTTTISVGSKDGTAIPATCLVTVYTELGDANMDGFVNISDVTDLIDYLLGAEVTNFKQENADLDGDGRVTISDVTELIDILLSSNNKMEEQSFKNYMNWIKALIKEMRQD